MKKAAWMLGMVVLLGSTLAQAALSYTDSRGRERVLTRSPDRLAVVPAVAPAARQQLLLHPALDLEAGVIEHDGLWILKLRPQYQGQGEELTRQLLAAGLAERAGLVFAVRGSDAFTFLDRGVLVRFTKQPAEATDLLARAGLEIEKVLDERQAVYLCRAEDAEAALAAARQAARLPGVAWALPDFGLPISLYFTPNDPYYGEQWHLYQTNGHHIHADEAWDITLGDNAVIVAVVDTGLDEGHPDFDPARIVTGYDVPDNDNDPTPPADSMNAHGTCCSGEIAASGNNSEGGSGVCPACSLMGIRMMDAWTTVGELSEGYQAINYATNNGAWVISNSWGINQQIIDGGQVDMAPYYAAVQNAVNNGRGGLGAVVLFASGNGDSSGNAVAIGPDELANMPEVMAVGGTNHNDIVVSYSNYGPNLSVVAPTGGLNSGDPQILTTDTIGSRGFSRNGTFWAPGWWGDYDTGQPEPDSTGNYTRYFNGTSAACPIAAGVVALVLAVDPTYTGAQARFIVEQTADKVGGVSYDSNGHNNYYGFGRVNAGRAVRAAELGFNNPLGSLCAENFNCQNDDCQKDSPGDFYGYCGGQDCSSLPDGTPCDDGDPCTENDACLSGVCGGSAKNCSDGNVCTDDSCRPSDGQCLHTNNNAACDDGDACTLSDTCSGGTCTGTPRDCDDGNVCTDDSCNSATGQCQYSNNSSTCNDGDPCTVSDTCSGGSCAGSPKDCSDGNVCTDDSCNPSDGQCLHDNNNVACDDGDLCTENDVCSGGACSGTAKDCDDGNVCTTDSCNSTTGQCANTNNSASCDDGDPCTVADTCSGGSCAGSPKDCSDGNPCTDDLCNPNSGECVNPNNSDACDDGDACTEGDTCVAGSCTGTAKTCDDGNLCTDDSCDPATGQCQFVNNSVSCDDGDACTEADTCSGGSCAGIPKDCDDGNLCTTDSCNPQNGQCRHVEGVDCDDGNPCTDDACNPANGQCTHGNNSNSCDDGNPCTENDTCALGACSGTPKDCGDGNPCTDDACDPADGSCSHADNTAACDDGDPCTTGDVCAAGSCTGSPLDADGDGHGPVSCGGDDCDDQNAAVHGGLFEGPYDDAVCSDGLDNDCDGQTDAADSGCQRCSQDADCDDGNVCNGAETCSGGSCQAGSALDCDDDNVCTDDTCDPASGCQHAANDAACDDGSACTSGDHCAGGQCTGTAVDCSEFDGVCQVGTCDPATGQCSAQPAPDGSPCDDGDSCTGADTCQQGQCVGGADTCGGSGGCGCATQDPRQGLALVLLLGLLLAWRRRS